MTRDEILAMKPGRKLDVLVAEKVLGKTVVCIRTLRGYQWCNDDAQDKFKPVCDEVPCIQEHGVCAYLTHRPNEEYVLRVVPFYSQEIEAAWQVVEHLDACLHLREHGTEGRWEAHFCALNEHKECGHGDTAAEAICKAALLAVTRLADGEKERGKPE